MFEIENHITGLTLKLPVHTVTYKQFSNSYKMQGEIKKSKVNAFLKKGLGAVHTQNIFSFCLLFIVHLLYTSRQMRMR